MKKILSMIIAYILIVVMTVFTPMRELAPTDGNISKAAGGDEAEEEDDEDVLVDFSDEKESAEKELYIKEIKMGIGIDSVEAKQELLDEKYILLCDDKGSPVDLNEDCGTNSGMSSDYADRVVYLGFKTTTDPKDAITDLAVMNMEGGFDFDEYGKLIDDMMNTQIIPFVKRFISTLEEYRKNYKKGAKTLNHKRADYSRRMLNLLYDDDTGMLVGDLLLEKTKYELGDKKYNALSNAEKKKHADIVTLLCQANIQATQAMESLLSKAADCNDDTWLERFGELSLDSLKKEVKKNDPSISSQTDVNKELDRLYHDTAVKIVDKWDGFSEVAGNCDKLKEEVDKDLKDGSIETQSVDDIVEGYNEKKASIDETAEVMGGLIEKQAEDLEKAGKIRDVVLCEALKKMPYDGDTMFDFFSMDSSEFSGDAGLRKLYPMVAALSPGQIAGLDFLSMQDLFGLCVDNPEAFRSTEVEKLDPTSVYEGVDRGIYEPGAVALTSDAIRSKHLDETPGNAKISGWTIGSWVVSFVGIVTMAVGFGLLKYWVKNVSSANMILSKFNITATTKTAQSILKICTLPTLPDRRLHQGSCRNIFWYILMWVMSASALSE